MLKAAYGRFCAGGYAGTTMEAIARDADVAVQTLYFTFKTKAALLHEVVGASIVGFDEWAPMPAGPPSLVDLEAVRRVHPFMNAVFDAPDARASLVAYLEGGGADLMNRVAPLVAVMREAALADAEARQLYDLVEPRRVEAYTRIVRVLAKKPPGLRPGLSPKRATDIFLAVHSGEVWEQLRARGWTKRQTTDWLVEVLAQQLLAPVTHTAGRR
jgi:AcrR family transcriptional regulator